MNKSSPMYAYSRYIALGLAASGGLICAACISALPSAQCGALANVYLQGIQAFGSAGFSGIVILGGIETMHRDGQVHHKTDVLFAIFFIALGGAAMLLGLILSATGLPAAVRACWPS